MNIEIAKTAGFCFGVKNAVNEVYKQIAAGEGQIATLGELIHNSRVIADLETHNVHVYETVAEIPQGMTVVIRAHGVGEDVIRELEAGGYRYLDLTCPFVQHIHNIVHEYYAKGYGIIIVGDKNHPEVIGINGWCGYEALVVYDQNNMDLQKFAGKDVCVVAQTTINREIFGEIVRNIKKACQKVLVFDTICSATKDRQEETDRLSARSDVMLVIGGRKSSNTRQLYEIAKRNCACTYFIESNEDLPHDIDYFNKKIGITAGASTPGSSIEEVCTTMDEIMKNEENFAELFEQYGSKTLNNGDIVDGTVVEVRGNEVIVDLGVKYNGQLAADQLTDDPFVKPSDVVKEGDTIRVYVVGVNDAEGKVVLSRKKLVAMESWNRIKEAYENKEILEAKIIKAVKGGVIALAESYQIFVPARQASLRFVQDLETLLNTTVRLRIIEIDERRKRVVGSVRNVLEEEKKALEEQFWANAEIGKKYTGTVKSLTSFGAFVDIGGVDGLVHISELSWDKIKSPSEVVKEGDVIEVYIKDINQETKKISLGYKNPEDDPWVIAQKKYNVGDVVKCTIVRMMPFGAFAQIMPNVDGLIHISQIADRRIGKPEDVLTIGEEVEAKITDANWETKKISLSIRALIAPTPEEVEKEEAPAPALEEDAPVDIEQFIKDEAAKEEAAASETADSVAEQKDGEEPVKEEAAAADTDNVAAEPSNEDAAATSETAENENPASEENDGEEPAKEEGSDAE